MGVTLKRLIDHEQFNFQDFLSILMEKKNENKYYSHRESYNYLYSIIIHTFGIQ